MTTFESAAIAPGQRLQPHRQRPARTGPRRPGVGLHSSHVFGVQPRLGRAFAPDEDQAGHDQVVILSDSLWRRRYQADPAIVGRKILLDRQAA